MNARQAAEARQDHEDLAHGDALSQQRFEALLQAFNRTSMQFVVEHTHRMAAASEAIGTASAAFLKKWADG